MKKLLTIENSLEALATLVAGAGCLGVLQTFIIGRHFVIPTMVLVLVVLFGNLAYFGLRGELWAKRTLFWLFFVLGCHAFFALFWAAEARPGAALGAGFYPVYGGVLLSVGYLCFLYARRNSLFGARLNRATPFEVAPRSSAIGRARIACAPPR
jgi:hypothetical protein